MKPKISVLVPVYNVERYIRECLDSIINQTMKDFEVILVDDGSTDKSGVICDEYEKKDNRFKVIHQKNAGSLLARKEAVLIAKGDYIVFVDSDDLLSSKNSLHRMYEIIEKENVDILQFSIELLQKDGSRNIADNLGWHKVHEEKINGRVNIIKACVDNRYNWCLWNKIYKASVCKAACNSIKNKRVISAEDCYAYFLIVYNSNKYKGVNTDPLYVYRLGSGITTRNDHELERFEMFCRENLIVGWLNEFISLQNLNKEEISSYSDILNNLSKNRFLNHCFWRYEQLMPKNKEMAHKYLCEYFDIKDVIGKMGERYDHFKNESNKLNKDLLGLKEILEGCKENEKSLKEDLLRLKETLERFKKEEKILKKDIMTYKMKINKMKLFNIKDYIKSKIFSKISMGKKREYYIRQYKLQKSCYKLIKDPINN